MAKSYKPKLKEIATMQSAEFTAEHLERVVNLYPEKLIKLARLAQGQEPPNEFVIGLVAAVAMSTRDEQRVLRHDTYEIAPALAAACPNVDTEALVQSTMPDYVPEFDGP